jgi:hypothetical protein
MVDIFNEITEELKRDSMARFWKKHSGKVMGALALGLLAVAGWNYWNYQKEQKARDAAMRYNSISMLIKDNKNEEAEKVLSELTASEADGFRLLARFRLAAEVGKRDASEGVKAFQALVNDEKMPSSFRDLARLRGVMLNVDAMPYAEVQTVLAPLAQATNPWRNGAREMLGLSALKAKAYEDAGRYFDQMMIDPQTTPSMRSRIEVYLGLVRSQAGNTPPAKSGM